MRSQEDFEDEVRSHLELEAERLRVSGVDPQAAELAARHNFGNVGIAQERFHEARPLRWLLDLGRDIRHAARTLLRAPGFAIAVVFTLALGIGANSAMFTIVNAVLFRPLPYPESHRIVSLSRTEDGMDGGVLDDRNFRALAAGGAQSLAGVAASSGGDMTVTTPAGPQEIYGGEVTPQFFAVYGFAPLLGRTFTADEAQPDGPPIVVLSEQFWRNGLGGDSAVLGKTLVIDTRPHTVIGVMPAALTSAKRPQFWIPLRIEPPVPGSMSFWYTYARMRPDATIEAVRAEVATVQRRTFAAQSAKHRRQQELGSVVKTMHERRFGDSRRVLLLLWATVGVLLLIACANIANLSLARAAKREREFSLRLALGASRGRIVRYVLSECVVLSIAGAALGALLAMASVGYFVRISPGAVANAEGVRVDGVALGFTLVVAVATALLFGMVPALRAARGNVSLVGTPRAAGSRREQLVRRTLIVAQLAAALVMLTGAAIVTKTLARVTSIDTGFETGNLLVIRPSLGDVRYTPASAGVFYEELMARLRRDPDVRSVALVDAVPLGGVRQSVTTEDSYTGKKVHMDFVRADAAYFQTIGARLVEGRWFNESDAPGAPNVTIVTEALARDQFPGRSALGQTVTFDGRQTIVGVVHDIRQRGLEEAPRSVAFFPLAQKGLDQIQNVIVRTSPNSAALAERVRTIVREMDAAQVPPRITTMQDTMDEAIAPRRFTVLLLGIFAGLAATLAIVGLYSVLSYLVAERTREIGIRVALGADSGRVLRFVLGSGMTLTLIGVVLGAAASAFTVRLLESMVYDMSVYDPWTFAASAGLLVVVALLASYIPARRAAAIDPVRALRME